MYTYYSNNYLGLNPNLGYPVKLPPNFPAQNNLPLPQIMANNVYSSTVPMAQSGNSMSSMMGEMFKFMLLSKQMESMESGTDFDEQKLNLMMGVMPSMGGNNGMGDIFQMMLMMSQFKMLEGEYDNSTMDAKEVKVKDLSPEFMEKIKDIANEINCDQKDLLAVMHLESGLNSASVNKRSKTRATGLIQFTKDVAKSLGITQAELKRMSPEKQLDYVRKYLVSRKTDFAKMPLDKKLSGGELYALIFLPARANNEVLTRRGEKYYTENKVLDKNKDGKITKSDLDNLVEKRKKVIFKDG